MLHFTQARSSEVVENKWMSVCIYFDVFCNGGRRILFEERKVLFWNKWLSPCYCPLWQIPVAFTSFALEAGRGLRKSPASRIPVGQVSLTCLPLGSQIFWFVCVLRTNQKLRKYTSLFSRSTEWISIKCLTRKHKSICDAEANLNTF